MGNDTLRYALIMLVAGIGIPVLATLNTQLGSRIGSPAAAAAILFVVAFLASAATLAVTAGTAPLSLLFTQPLHLYLGGILVAFYVLSISWIAPHFGIGNAIFCVLLGQIMAAAVIDHFGLFGAAVHPMNSMRAVGIAIMAAGVLLAQRA
jgi:bacterial/archaeal transporter family-2 protein